MTDAVNLGWSLSGEIPLRSDKWGMTIVSRYDEKGRPSTLSVVFTPQQAREIARRINAFYGTDEEAS